MVVSCAPVPHKLDSNCWCVDNVRYMFGKLKKNPKKLGIRVITRFTLLFF